jgi:hypothetical protein
MHTWSNLIGAFFLFENERKKFMNTKYQEDSIIITIVYQDVREYNKRHSNFMSFICYISFLISCTVLRTCALSEKWSISFLTRFICFLHEGSKNNTLVLPLYIFIYKTKMHLPTLTLALAGYWFILQFVNSLLFSAANTKFNQSGHYQ